MAKQPGLGFQSTKGGLGELKYKLLFVIDAPIVFRIGSFIPIPGIDATVLAKLLEQQRGTIIEMFNMFLGGASSRASTFTLGIMPYISTSITIQLPMVVRPTLAEIKREGEPGRRKISQYTRYGTLMLVIFQSIGTVTGLPNIPGMQGLVMNPGFAFYFIAVVSLATGTMFLMWLGEQITERGIGNGISIIIFAGIVAGLPLAIAHTIEQAHQGDLHSLVLLLVVILVSAVTFFVVFVECGQRRIMVNYAKHQRGCRVYAVQSIHLPLKVNMVGATPAILASSIILFPVTIAPWFGGGTGWSWLIIISLYLQPGQPLYVLFYASVTTLFCFLYTALVFDPCETVDNLKKPDAFVLGIRPGKQTAKYIDKVMTRLALVGVLYIIFICLILESMRDAMRVPFCFGRTSLFIAAVVVMDSTAQVQTLMVPGQHESALKKANLKGYGR